MAKVIHYRERCIGCNACVEIAPQSWRISRKDGKAVLLGSIVKKNVHQAPILEYDIEDNEKAALACPVKIIKIG